MNLFHRAMHVMCRALLLLRASTCENVRVAKDSSHRRHESSPGEHEHGLPPPCSSLNRCRDPPKKADARSKKQPHKTFVRLQDFVGFYHSLRL